MPKTKPALSTAQRIRLFYLQRDTDESGVSGIGIVAEGVEFSNGTCAMTWVVGPHHCVNIYDNIKSIEAIHGHEGQTKIVFIHIDKRAA